MTVRASSCAPPGSSQDGITYITDSRVPQRAFLGRAVYFVLVGWWLGAVWSALAWLLCVTVLGLPLGVMMYNRLPAVLTLRRY